MKRLWVIAALAARLCAQPPVAPATESIGSARGESYGDYLITNSWEAGYRFSEVGGNVGTYRSDVNYGNGIRLFGARFTMNSKDGHGRFIDEVLVNIQGLGNDPYEFANWRVAKNKLYRYDGVWRRNDYYNPALPIIQGSHFLDTIHRLQDHDFTLFPQSAVRFFFGFSRVTQSGTGLSTVNFNDSTANIFPVVADIHRSQNEIRFGNEFRLAGIRINWMGTEEWFHEDVPLVQSTLSTGLFPDGSTLSQFTRTQPYDGTTPSFRGSILREQGRLWAINGRFTYSHGTRFFTTDETAVGTSRFGGALNRQTLVDGNGHRPVMTANLTLSLFPTERLTITNHTAYHDLRMYGDAEFTQIDNATLSEDFVSFQYLGVRTFTNATTANYAWTKKISLRGGYQYAERRIRSEERRSELGFNQTIPGDQTSHLNAATAGVRLQPWGPLTLLFDGEFGRTDRPFTPISQGDYHGLSARAMYKKKALTLSAVAQSDYNLNSATLSVYSSHTRRYAVDASWALKAGFSLEAGYSRLHLDTAGGIAYFVSFQLIQGEQSLFYSNVHTGQLGVRFAVRNRADFYLGYSGIFDVGDNNHPAGASLAVFQRVQTFPMGYQAALARVSIRINKKLRWNAGYQYYGYREDLMPTQGYRANTGYTSLLFAF
jgi:hypothetical protein